MRQQRLRRTSVVISARNSVVSFPDDTFVAFSSGGRREADPFHSFNDSNPQDADENPLDVSSVKRINFSSRRRALIVALALLLSSLVAWRVIKSAVVWLGLACACVAFAAVCLLCIGWLWRSGWRKLAACFASASLIAILFFGANVVAVFFDPKIDHALRSRMPIAQHAVFYTRQVNNQLMPVYSESERFVAPDEVWESWFRSAAIAIEDERFLTRHEGVIDVEATLRAIKENIQNWKIKEGGSGIEVQTAKLMLGSFKTEGFLAKFEQYFIAMRLAQRFDDPSVRFCIYANIVFLSGKQRGVGIAAAELFGKYDLRSCSISESALLAGMLQNAVTFDPRLHPQAALTRRNVVLDKMLELGMISKEQHLIAINEAINILPRNKPHELLARAAIEIREASAERMR